MIRTTLAAFVTTVSVAATPVAAATIADVFSSFWVFGDSLSDNGNLAALTGFPPPPYDAGRFTNGEVWNERFLADFGPGSGANFAFGSARAVPNPGTGLGQDSIPDLPDQVGAFLAVRPSLTLGDRSLASVFVGANDVFATIAAAGAAGAAAAVTDPASVAGVVSGVIDSGVTAAITRITAEVKRLSDFDIDEFALWNLPDLGTTPRLVGGEPGAAMLGTQATLAYNLAFDGMVAGLIAEGLTIHTVDTFGLFVAATANPDRFGLSNLTEACFPVDPSDLLIPGFVPPPVCTDADTRLYWDKLHPTRVGHDALAVAFDAAVPAIPLPASALLLLGGLGAFAAFRRRAA